MSKKPICDEPCPYGGSSAARKYSHSDLGHMWHCNRHVRRQGEKCWQHRAALDVPGRTEEAT